MNGTNVRCAAAIRIERDLRYGEGAIGWGTASPRVRDLYMDVFVPPEVSLEVVVGQRVRAGETVLGHWRAS